MIGGDSKFVLTCTHTRVPLTPTHTFATYIIKTRQMGVEIGLFPIPKKEKGNSPVLTPPNLFLLLINYLITLISHLPSPLLCGLITLTLILLCFLIPSLMLISCELGLNLIFPWNDTSLHGLDYFKTEPLTHKISS